MKCGDVTDAEGEVAVEMASVRGWPLSCSDLRSPGAFERQMGAPRIFVVFGIVRRAGHGSCPRPSGRLGSERLAVLSVEGNPLLP